MDVTHFKQHPDVAPTATIDLHSLRSGVAQVVLGGEQDLASVGQLGEILSQALASHSHLIVDLRPTEFIDASTISTLVRAKDAAHERDCRFSVLLSTTEIVERALEITGALHTLNRVHSMEEALEAAVS